MRQHQLIKYKLMKAMAKDLSKLVRVARQVVRKGKTILIHMWVSPDKVKHDDKVTHNHHNLPDSHPQRYKIFADTEDAFAYMGDKGEKGTPYGNWEDATSDTEQEAVITYTGTKFYRKINGTLRGTRRKKLEREELSTIQKLIHDIDTALSKFELKEDIMVFRRTHIRMYQKYLDAYNNSGLYRERGFLSTTLVKDSFGTAQVDITIKIPRGKGRGAWIAPKSKFRHENEFLLARGQMFRVLAVHPPEEGKNALVELELLPAEDDNMETESLKKSAVDTSTDDRADRFTAHEEDAEFIYTPEELRKWAKRNGKSDKWLQQILAAWKK